MYKKKLMVFIFISVILSCHEIFSIKKTLKIFTYKDYLLDCIKFNNFKFTFYAQGTDCNSKR